MPDICNIYFDQNNNMAFDCRQDPDLVLGKPETIDLTFDFIVVGGGGAGGLNYNSANAGSGGGGAGGFLYLTGQTMSPGTYPIFIGSGATTTPNGGVTTFSGYTVLGGGKGGTSNPWNAATGIGINGASGGGGAARLSGIPVATGGTASNGSNGGNGWSSGARPAGGGGGGFITSGATAAEATGGNGGLGIQSFIRNPSGEYFCGGGGGTKWDAGGTNGTGGSGVGGNGISGAAGGAGATNTGSGGGAGYPAGVGGSGIVIIRYQSPAPFATGGNITKVGNYIVHSFTSNGNFVLS